MVISVCDCLLRYDWTMLLRRETLPKFGRDFGDEVEYFIRAAALIRTISHSGVSGADISSGFWSISMSLSCLSDSWKDQKQHSTRAHLHRWDIRRRNMAGVVPPVLVKNRLDLGFVLGIAARSRTSCAWEKCYELVSSLGKLTVNMHSVRFLPGICALVSA